MRKRNTYKSRKLKLKMRVNLLFLFTALFLTGCFPPANIDEVHPVSIELKHQKVASQGQLLPIEVQVTNHSLSPITILGIQIAQPRTTTSYKGTTYLKALKHEFKKGERFSRKSFINTPPKNRDEHVVPEVHKIKNIIPAGATRGFPLKAIAQNIKGDIYVNTVMVSYLKLDASWNHKIYSYIGKKVDKSKNTIQEFYRVMSQGPSKNLLGSLLSSGDLGASKTKETEVRIQLKGFHLDPKKTEIGEEYVFFKSRNSWLHSTGADTFLTNSKNESIQLKDMNMARPFMKATLKGKVKVYVHKQDYKALEALIKTYSLRLKENYFEGTLSKRQLYDFFDEIYKKGYGMHKHGEVLKLK